MEWVLWIFRFSENVLCHHVTCVFRDIRINLIVPETSHWLHFAADSMGLSSFKFSTTKMYKNVSATKMSPNDCMCLVAF